MAIAYVSTNTTKKSGNSSSAGQACVDYIRREGKYAPENYQEEGHSQESIVEISQAVPRDWEGQDFRKFAEDGDLLERVNGASFRKMVVAIPREIQDQKERTEYANRWIEHQGLNQFPHLAVLHNQENNPHFHIVFSERNLNFNCPNRPDGSKDIKAFFSRQNPKDPQFGAGDRQMGQQWLKDVKAKNIDMVRTVPGLENWQPPKGKAEPKIGPAWKNVDPTIREEIQNKVSNIRSEKATQAKDTAATVITFGNDKAQTVQTQTVSAIDENQKEQVSTVGETVKPNEVKQQREDAKKEIQNLQQQLKSADPKSKSSIQVQLTTAQTRMALLEAKFALEATRDRQSSDKAGEKAAKQQMKDAMKVLEGSPKESTSQHHSVQKSPSSSGDSHTLDRIVAMKEAAEAQKRQEDQHLLKQNEHFAKTVDHQREQQAKETAQQQAGMARETTQHNSLVSAADRADFMNDLKAGMRQTHENGDTSKPMVDLNEGARATYNQFQSMTPEKQDAAILAHREAKNDPEFSNWKNSHRGNSLANGLSDIAQMAVGNVIEKDQPSVRFTNSADFTKKKKKKPWQL